MPNIYSVPKTFLISHFLQGCSQLVWTACRLVTTSNTLQSGDDFLGLHALNQGTNALGVAIAASDELGILHSSIFINTDADVFLAGAMSLISNFSQLIFLFLLQHDAYSASAGISGFMLV